MSYGIIIKLIPFSALKVLFLKLLGAKIGKNCKIGYFSTISTKKYSNIVIGDFVTIGHNTDIKVSNLFIDNLSIIGSNVEINGYGKLSIGKSCYIPKIYIDTSGGVKLKIFLLYRPREVYFLIITVILGSSLELGFLFIMSISVKEFGLELGQVC